ncbi:MAG: hypothetical protein ABIY52_00165, partial [Gemmatimonadaceae bacterium]
PGAKWQHEELAARIAESARAAGRPVAVTPSLPAAERALLGSSWTMVGFVYVAGARADGSREVPVDRGGVGTRAAVRRGSSRSRLSDDVSGTMLRLLDCPALATPERLGKGLRDSLEVSCNFR